jgi:hypothetical protein
MGQTGCFVRRPVFDKRSHGNGGNSANIVVGDTDMKDAGYGIFPTILSVS